jgi:hypothetical protein
MSLPAKSALKNVPRSAADGTIAPAVHALVAIEVRVVVWELVVADSYGGADDRRSLFDAGEVGVIEPEWLDDSTAKDVGHRHARDVFDEQTKKDVVGIRVAPARTWFAQRRHVASEGEDLLRRQGWFGWPRIRSKNPGCASPGRPLVCCRRSLTVIPAAGGGGGFVTYVRAGASRSTLPSSTS